MTKQKFFFEEDTSVSGQEESGITWDEHADTFFNVLEGAGVTADKDSLAPKGVETERYKTTSKKTQLLELEYGIIKEDYVIHITPCHPHRNLTQRTALAEAVKACVFALNDIVPFDLKVRLHLPQDNWEIKAISFVIEGGADAWNLNRETLEQVTIPDIEAKVTAICMKAK